MQLCETCIADLTRKLAPSRQPVQKKIKMTHGGWQLPGVLTSNVASTSETNRVTVAEELTKQAKPHQKEGVEFIWKRCFSDLVGVEDNVG